MHRPLAPAATAAPALAPGLPVAGPAVRRRPGAAQG